MRERADLDPWTRQDCEQVLERLKEKLGEDLISFVLYGSTARGGGTEHSDYDFYVTAKNLPERPIPRSVFLRGLLFGLRLRRRFSIRGKRPGEVRDVLPLFLDMAVDGVIFYDWGDFMRDFLKKVLKKIEESRLTRYRTPDGYYAWRFERPIQVGENLVVSLEA